MIKINNSTQVESVCHNSTIIKAHDIYNYFGLCYVNREYFVPLDRFLLCVLKLLM